MEVLSKIKTQNKAFLVFAGYVLIGIIGFVDYLTGYEVGLSIFYVFPISLITWVGSQKAGVVAVATGAVVWYVAEIASMPPSSHVFIPIWNTLIRLTFFGIITFLLFSLKNSLEQLKKLSGAELVIANHRLLDQIIEKERVAAELAAANQEIKGRFKAMQALQENEQAVTVGPDKNLVLNAMLGYTRTELHGDAFAVLLLNPSTQILEFAAGIGFRTQAIEGSRLQVGAGYGGRAALERRTVSVTDLPENNNQCVRTGLLADEGFVTYCVTPLIAKGTVRGVLEVFHRVPFVPDQDWLIFFEILAAQTAIAVDNISLFTDVQLANTGLFNDYDSIIEGWSHTLDCSDTETKGHTQRVTELTMKLARTAGMTEAELVHVRRGALLHDIGKMGVPDHILHKPDTLTGEEWIAMRKHPILAFELLSTIPYLRPALDIPYCHYEKWDGSGYPRGLQGEQIPLAARLFSIIDVWDALSSERPYRHGWENERVIKHITTLSGTHYEPKAVDLFLKMKHEDDNDSF